METIIFRVCSLPIASAISQYLYSSSKSSEVVMMLVQNFWDGRLFPHPIHRVDFGPHHRHPLLKRQHSPPDPFNPTLNPSRPSPKKWKVKNQHMEKFEYSPKFINSREWLLSNCRKVLLVNRKINYPTWVWIFSDIRVWGVFYLPLAPSQWESILRSPD